MPWIYACAHTAEHNHPKLTDFMPSHPPFRPKVRKAPFADMIERAKTYRG